MYIPDPIEIMEDQQERLARQWDDAHRDVPEGSFRCPYCSLLFGYEPYQLNASPVSPFVCFSCLQKEWVKPLKETP